MRRMPGQQQRRWRNPRARCPTRLCTKLIDAARYSCGSGLGRSTSSAATDTSKKSVGPEEANATLSMARGILGGDRERNAAGEALKKIAGAGHGLDRGGELQFDAGEQLGLQLAIGAWLADVVGHVVASGLQRAAGQQIFFCGTEPETVVGEQRRLCTGPARFGVEKQAVTIENNGTHDHGQASP